jgi:hypothetical protein
MVLMIIPTGYGQANLFFVGAGVPRTAQIAIGFDNNAVLSAADLAAVIGALWATEVMPLFSETITLEKVKVKYGPNDTGAEGTANIGVPGTLANEPMPPNVALLAKKVTAAGGKKNAGKMFVPAIPEADSDGGGLLIPARLAAWNDALEAFFDGMTAADVPIVVLHSDVTTPTTVLALDVEQKLATQKRRLRRAGGRRTPTP